MTALLRQRLLATSLLVGAGMLSTQAVAQEATTGAVQDNVAATAQSSEGQTTADPSQGTSDAGEIVVTGSRISRPDLEANSPLAVVSGEEVVQQADVTIEQYLNTLPQVNAAGGTTSNNPPNGGRANIDLRGLGANRNLVLIDGRRPMVAFNDQTVDLNVIPQALIERIEVITGGAGAAYGADAVAGVVNIRMKDNFQGLDIRGTLANTLPDTDARDYQISGVIGGNFDDERGNIALAVDYSNRSELGKVARRFAQQATSTTPTPPTGRYVDGNNAPSQAAVNAIFTGYGSRAQDIPVAGGGGIAFNSDGTLFGTGAFNLPRDVTNFRYGVNSLTAAPNLNYFPDFYSYNFDIVNVLQLPLERKAAYVKGNYEVSRHADFFVQGGYTQYTSATGSAPTPLGVSIENPCGTLATRAKSILINCNSETTGARATITGLAVPVTNPFIPADLRTLLNSRTGNDPALAGSGATEPFRLAYRFLPTGLRRSEFDTRVVQGLAGLRGEITDGWRYEAYASHGETQIDTTLTGGVNVQRVQDLLQAADGGASQCAGGFNPFGIQPLSQACVDFVDEAARTRYEFEQNIIQGYVTGELVQLPAGPLSVVVGAERRKFDYSFDPGTLSGPIAGPNTGVAEGGTSTFRDVFGEVLIPILRDAPWARSLEINLSARNSKSKFVDLLTNNRGGSTDWTYGGTLSYEPSRALRFRASYQRAVRAPNPQELFAGGSTFPQYFDPCSVTSNFRTAGGAAARALCVATGVSAPDAYVQTPGSQVFATVAGNTNVRPEKANTVTLGGVFQAFGFTGSVDYYNIRLKDTIVQGNNLNANAYIAACYGYHGLNASLAATNPYCSTITGNRTPDISQLVFSSALGGNAAGAFLTRNQGRVNTSGIDVQLGYSLPTQGIVPNSRLRFNLLTNYLIEYEVEELPGVFFDYSDTVAFFGAGLGQTFPRFRGTLNTEWDLGWMAIDSRIRYIDAMKNRASVIFPGETSFTGVPRVWYFDFGAEFRQGPVTLRLGLNNAFNKQPPTYAPNVQSGTDPSVYDILGRRGYASVRLKF